MSFKKDGVQEYRGSEAYENERFFEQYMARRARENSPNNTIEQPIMDELLGGVEGLDVLDLGCGDGTSGVSLLKKGAQSYTGVEGSGNMAKLARKNLADVNGRVHTSTMEKWNYPEKQYDLVISRLAFHYLEDLTPIFKKVYGALKPEGRFVFSVQHPVLTSTTKSAAKSGRRTDWIVDDYFQTGKRVEPWIDEKVVKYHRTTEDYFAELKKAGFQVEDLREGRPNQERFSDEQEFQRRNRIPLFLIFSAKK
ncbi:class I SAM-dependent DNA methyltransferase [Pseudalkalibacillus caeni]|uniref:Methyltransferase domain-containing protein n=1 Tax=Exobacillus caeni TaxID=2574798 RepID=A0A5R9F128_9BACL|nr:methyltransferase domain-containing protein [Pseudalkalibacillus caeni]TLS37267.1 methyltransferase domain-containing protein [Pseudalkalibacillus caeni]